MEYCYFLRTKLLFLSEMNKKSCTFVGMKTETIILEDLTIGYHSKKQHRVVTKSLNASLLGGELTCLIGANGVGKSTLLRTLAAFQPPLSGKISLCQLQRDRWMKKDLMEFSPRQLAKQVSVVLTSREEDLQLTMEEVVAIGRSPYTGFWGTLTEEDKYAVDEAILQVGIGLLRGRMLHTMSDGERQKVMLAKALAQQTPIIFLDEPTAFLDYTSKVETLQMLRRLAHELHKTIFLSTHDVELALQLADKLWLMECNVRNGERQETDSCLSVGTPRQLAKDGSLARFINRKGIVFNQDTLTITVN